MLQREVLKSIRKDEIEEGIFLLEQFIEENDFIKTKFAKNLASISRRLKELDKSKSLGVISFDLYALEKNKIVDSLLILLDDVDCLDNSNKPIYSSEINSTDIWVVINGNYEDFNESQKQELLSKIGKALQIDQHIQIKQIYPGSIRLLLSLPVKSAIKLFKMIKEGALQSLDILDVYFNVEHSFESIKNAHLNFAADRIYYEIGYRLGFHYEESFKNNLIETYKKLYEESIWEEKHYKLKILNGLEIKLENLEGKLLKRIKNLNRLKSSSYLLEFFLEDTKRYYNSNSEVNSKDIGLITKLIDNKHREIDLQEISIQEIQERIDELNNRKDSYEKNLGEDLFIKRGYWENKLLKIIEEIEKGFSLGYVERNDITRSDDPDLPKQFSA